MGAMIASSSYSSKSYSLVQEQIACSYPRNMRGEQLRAIRLANLRKLRETYTLEEIANRSATNATYLSQIVNEVVQARGKRPRSLSDDYAAKIEAGLGLEPGWMDRRHDSGKGDVPLDAPVPGLEAIAGSVAVSILTPPEAEWLDLYRALPDAQRQALAQAALALFEANKGTKK